LSVLISEAIFEGPTRIPSGSSITFESLHEIIKLIVINDLGILLCVDENNRDEFSEIMRLLKSQMPLDEERVKFWELIPGITYDRDSNKIIGAMTLSSALREYASAQALSHHWALEYDTPCPVPFVLGIIKITEIPFYDQTGNLVRKVPLTEAFTHPLLQEIPEEWRRLGGVITGLTDIDEDARLADWMPNDESKTELNLQITNFALRISRLIKIAHKYLGGTFSSEYASALTSTNVSPSGVVQDLETFVSTMEWTIQGYEDFNLSLGGQVHSKYQFLDLELMIELIAEYSLKIDFEQKDLKRYLQIAYEQYTETNPSLDYLQTASQLPRPSESVYGFRNYAQKLAGILYQQARWRMHE
jgi:hypothetical protein